MKALVHKNQNRILQIETNAKVFPVSPNYKWVTVPASTTTRDSWDGTKVVKYVRPVAEAQSKKYDRVLSENKLIKGFIIGINDGTIIPGSNMTAPQIRSAILTALNNKL